MPEPVIVVPKKRGRGCLGCGCAVLVVLVLLFLALVIFGGIQAYHLALGFTGSQPVAVPAVIEKPGVYDGAQRKLNDFEDAFERVQPATLRLSGDEINALIEHDPGYAQLHGRLFLALQGSTANLQASLPLGSFEKAFLPDRYLNANGTLGLAFDPATRSLLLDVQTLSLNGQDIPPTGNASLNQVLNQLINQRLQANQLARDFLARVQKADIEDGELVIEMK